MTRLFLAAGLMLALTPVAAGAQSAPPLTGLQIVAVSSATQSERIAPDQTHTNRPHTGPISVVVQETGIGRARVVRIDGAIAAPPSTQRPLCGSAVTAGACRPGEPMTGVEITYHLGPLRKGATVALQDTSANLPAVTLDTTITID